MAEKAKLSCVAKFNEKGGVDATLNNGKQVLATGTDFQGDTWKPDIIGPKPLSENWKGVADSVVPSRGPNDMGAHWKEDGFKINVENKTCVVTTVDGGGVPNKPITAPLTIDYSTPPPAPKR